MRIEQQQLKAFLLDSELVKPDDVLQAEKESKSTGVHLEEVLIKQGKISESNLARLKAYIFGIPFVSL